MPPGRVKGKRYLTAKDRTQEAQAAERACEAWNLLLKGKSATAIGREIGVSTTAVVGYLQKTRERLWKERLDRAEQWTLVHLERYEMLLEVSMPLALKGEAGACERVLQILRQEATLLGINRERAGFQADPGGKPFDPDALTEEQAIEAGERVLAFARARLARIKPAQVLAIGPGAGDRTEPPVDPPAGPSDGSLPDGGG